MLSKQEAAEAVRQAKVRTGITWAQLAEAVGKPIAWTTAALLELGDDAALAFQLQPTRGALPVVVSAVARVNSLVLGLS
jgi:cyanate lyase